MSIEAPVESPFSEADIQAAEELIQEDEILSKDHYSKGIVENGGMLPTGEYVKDLGDFLNARKDHVLSLVHEAKFEARVPQAEVMAISSVRPDLEQYM